MVRISKTPIAVDEFGFYHGVYIYLLSHFHSGMFDIIRVQEKEGKKKEIEFSFLIPFSSSPNVRRSHIGLDSFLE